MGFSTSGSLLLVFLGVMIAVGTAYTVSANTVERVTEATDSQRERFGTVQQSGIEVVDAVYNESGDEHLIVRVDNTGETTLDAEDVDVIVDGEYRGTGDFERLEVDGTDSAVWLPGDRLVLEDENATEAPTRVKVVSGPGVADIAFVGEVTG